MPGRFAYIRVFLLILIVFDCISGKAQGIGVATINAAGNTHTRDSIIYEWSAGEMALVETMVGTENSITNGLLQPLLPIHIITDGFPVYPSNILTANGDGTNDAWVIKDIERYPENELTVFDRGGRVVFYTKNYKNDWTGKLSGLPLSEDTYFYVLKLIKNGETGIKKGFITILN